MDSKILKMCKALENDLAEDRPGNQLAVVAKTFHVVFGTAKPEIYLPHLIRISRLTVARYPHQKTAEILRHAIENWPPIAKKYFKCVVCLVQNILSAMAPDERSFNREMIAVFLPVVSHILWIVPVSSADRMHAMSHLLWVLKPVLKIKIGVSFVVEYVLKDFVDCLHKCDRKTVLLIPKLTLLREVTTLLSNAIIYRCGPVAIDEILEPTYNRCNPEMKWILWLGICRGFLRKVNGCDRGRISSIEEKFFNGLMELSHDLENEKEMISPAFRDEVEKFYHEFKTIYHYSHQEKFNYRRYLFDIQTCVTVGCQLSMDGSQLDTVTDTEVVVISDNDDDDEVDDSGRVGVGPSVGVGAGIGTGPSAGVSVGVGAGAGIGVGTGVAIEPSVGARPGVIYRPENSVGTGVGIEHGVGVRPGLFYRSNNGIGVGVSIEPGVGIRPGIVLGPGNGVRPGVVYRASNGVGASVGIEPSVGVRPGLFYRASNGVGASVGIEPGAGVRPGLFYRPSNGVGASVGIEPGIGVRAGLFYRPSNGVGVGVDIEPSNGAVVGVGIDPSVGVRPGIVIGPGNGIRPGHGVGAGVGIEPGMGVRPGIVIGSGNGIRSGHGVGAGADIRPGNVVASGVGIGPDNGVGIESSVGIRPGNAVAPAVGIGHDNGVGAAVGIGPDNGVGAGVGIGSAVGVSVGPVNDVGGGVGVGVDVGADVGVASVVGVVADVGVGPGVGVGTEVSAGVGEGIVEEVPPAITPVPAVVDDLPNSPPPLSDYASGADFEEEIEVLERTRDDPPPSVNELVIMIQKFLNSNPEPLLIDLLKCLIDNPTDETKESQAPVTPFSSPGFNRVLELALKRKIGKSTKRTEEMRSRDLHRIVSAVESSMDIAEDRMPKVQRVLKQLRIQMNFTPKSGKRITSINRIPSYSTNFDKRRNRLLWLRN